MSPIIAPAACAQLGFTGVDSAADQRVISNRIVGVATNWLEGAKVLCNRMLQAGHNAFFWRPQRLINGKKVVVVMPAYRAEHTLEQTYESIPKDVVDAVILVDDASDDKTVAVAKRLGLQYFVHEKNMGYGANQKTCYREALKLGADVVVMLHPDYQYEPKLVTAMAAMVATGVYDAALASRILGNSQIKGGMPKYKYVANRILTLIQNILLGIKVSEFHSGYRAFNRSVLETLPLLSNSNDFIFDNQMITQIVAFEFKIGEISCPTKYFPEASSINFRRSVVYGLGVLHTSVLYWLWKRNLIDLQLFSKKIELKLDPDSFAASNAQPPQAPHTR